MKDNIIINKYSGFFLIELLVALGMIAIFFLFIYQFQANITIQKYDTRKYIEAINVVSSYISEISIYGLNVKKIKIKDFTINIEDIISTPNKKEGETSKQKQFILKKIIISWESLKGNERRLEFICGFIL